MMNDIIGIAQEFTAPTYGSAGSFRSPKGLGVALEIYLRLLLDHLRDRYEWLSRGPCQQRRRCWPGGTRTRMTNKVS